MIASTPARNAPAVLTAALIALGVIFAAFALAIVSWAGAWFTTGKRTRSTAS